MRERALFSVLLLSVVFCFRNPYFFCFFRTQMKRKMQDRSANEETSDVLLPPVSLNALRSTCTDQPWMCFRVPESQEASYDSLMESGSGKHNNFAGLLHVLHESPDEASSDEEESDDENSDDGASTNSRFVNRALSSRKQVIQDTDHEVKQWENNLCDKWGQWIVSIPTLSISRRFFNSLESQKYVMEMLRKIDPTLGPKSNQQEMRQMLKILNEDYARRFPNEELKPSIYLSEDLPGPGPFQNFEDVFQVGTFSGEDDCDVQEACCVYFHGINLSTKQIPLGNGPLEIFKDDGAEEIKGNWREKFQEVWLAIESALPHTLTCLTKESLVQYRKKYKELLDNQSEEFKQMLLSTFPKRLIYFDYKSQVFHASRWEEYRQGLYRNNFGNSLHKGYHKTNPVNADWCSSGELQLLPDDVLDCKFEFGVQTQLMPKILNVNGDFSIVDCNLTETDQKLLQEAYSGDWRKFVQALVPGKDKKRQTFSSYREFLEQKTKQQLEKEGKYGMIACLYERGAKDDEWVFEETHDSEHLREIIPEKYLVIHISSQGDLFEATLV